MKKLAKFLFILMSFAILLSFTSCDEENIDDTIVAISEKNIKLTTLGEEYVLTATVYPVDDNASIKWSTSNPEVATCINGVVTVTGYGVCVVRASYNNVTAACTVSVPDPSPNVFLSQNELTLSDIGAEATLVAKTDLGDDISTSVYWSTSNASIVSCQNGKLVAVGYGICTVTVMRDNKTDSCIVTVLDPNAPHLTLSSSEMSIAVGEMQNLTYTKSDNAGAQVTWISSNPKIANCQNGRITGIGKGVCAIIAITENGVSDACLVTVGNYAPPSLPSEIVTLEAPELPTKIKYVNSQTGQVTSIVAITSYDVTYEYVENTLELSIIFNCVKIYDSKGPGGTSPIIFMSNLYKENDVHCEKRFHTKAGVIIGETCNPESAFIFRVKISSSGVRYFRVEFPTVIEI